MSFGGQDKLGGAIDGRLSSIGLFVPLVLIATTSFTENKTSTYQVDGAVGGGLVLALLGEEKQTLSGLAGPGGKVVVLQEGGDLLGVNGITAEPEELLGVDEVPGKDVSDCGQEKLAPLGDTE